MIPTKNPIKGVFNNTRDILEILKCFPKIMKNFILCIFFYLMDCIKDRKRTLLKSSN